MRACCRATERRVEISVGERGGRSVVGEEELRSSWSIWSVMDLGDEGVGGREGPASAVSEAGGGVRGCRGGGMVNVGKAGLEPISHKLIVQYSCP